PRSFPLSLHDALPILIDQCFGEPVGEIAERAIAAIIAEVEHGDAILCEARGAAAAVAVTTEQHPRASGEHDHPDADPDIHAPSPDRKSTRLNSSHVSI